METTPEKYILKPQIFTAYQTEESLVTCIYGKVKTAKIGDWVVKNEEGYITEFLAPKDFAKRYVKLDEFCTESNSKKKQNVDYKINYETINLTNRSV